jgi:hypothetical protein
MDTEIITQIVNSLETWRDAEKVGEEVRAMNDAIINKSINDDDPTLEALITIIENFPNDYDLGKAIRRIYIPLKIMVNDQNNSEGSSN